MKRKKHADSCLRDMGQKYSCLVIVRPELEYKITPYFDETLCLIMKKEVKEVVNELRTRNIHCVIYYVAEKATHEIDTFSIVKKKFYTIPFLSIFNEKCLETARYFGKIGIDKVMHYSDIDHLSEEIKKLIIEKSVRITLKDIGIDEKYNSRILINALQIIESSYIKIMSVKEIAEILEINESSLSREFQKYNLPGPKRILMYFKINHASMLMRNKGLNKTEIALLSGFSSERRLNENLYRVQNKMHNGIAKKKSRQVF